MLHNPEFKRHLWQEISLHRLIAMPVILFLLMLTVLMQSAGYELRQLQSPALASFVLIVLMWGTRNVSACLIDEWRDQTWDQQRMSALSPWRMTWGKLFGATIFQWYGGLLCLGILLLAMLENPSLAFLKVGSLLGLAMFLHAANFAITLHLFSQNGNTSKRNNIAPLLFLLIVLGFALVRVWDKNEVGVSWWQYDIAPAVFWFYSSIAFAAWAVFAAWRVMASALQERSISWAWPAFALFLGVYFVGFQAAPDVISLLQWVLLFATLMTYLSLISSAHQRVQCQVWLLRVQQGDWLGLLQCLPIWVSSLALAILCSLLLQLHALNGVIKNDDLPQIANYVPPLAISLMLLRDIALLYFFALAKHAKRAVATTLLYLALLNGLLPILASLLGQAWLTYLLVPLSAGRSAYPMIAIFGMALHLLIAGAALRWRWKNTPSSF